MRYERTQVRIGGGAGFAGDRISPATTLVDNGNLDGLILECLAERTIALAQLRLHTGTGPGYDPRLEERFLPLLKRSRLPTITTNIGAADPAGAAQRLATLAASCGRDDLVVAGVTGDDVADPIRDGAVKHDSFLDRILETDAFISANAYIGADSLLPALNEGANIVIGGRIADPSLAVAIAAHVMSWGIDDTTRLARATLAGHLIECGSQATGGYFSDPGFDDVPGISNIGFPIAAFGDVDPVIIEKPRGTGGLLNEATVKEQLLYEITDPTEYITPDVKLAVDKAHVHQARDDRVEIYGAKGAARPDTLKVSVGYHAGYKVEGEISYYGAHATTRAREAIEIVQSNCGAIPSQFTSEILDGRTAGRIHSRARIAMSTRTQHDGALLARKIEALGTNGPSGGGGWRISVTPQVGIHSVNIDRSVVQTRTLIQQPGK